MTQVTDTTELAGLLGARKAEINGQPAAPEAPTEVITPEVVTATEVVPVTAEQTAAVDRNWDNPVQPPFPAIPPKVIGGLPYAAQYAKLAKTICNTEMVPGALRGRYDAVTAAFLRGYEMGLGPMQALDSFHVIDGKVGLTAEAMRALIVQAGHQILLEDVAQGGTVVAVRARCHRAEWADDMWMDYQFGLEDARQAGLLRDSRSGKPTSWQSYPRAMMDARATSGAGRRYFPDVLAGMSYTPEEIRDFGGPAIEEAPPSDPTPPQPTPAAAGQPASEATDPAAAPAPSESLPPCDSDPAETDQPAAGTAPEPPTPPPAKKASKKAAAKKVAAPPKEAPPKAEETPAPADSAAAPASPTETAPATADEPQPGETGVRRSMAQGLTEVIKGLPTVQQPLCRAFLAQHFPGRAVNDWTEEELQKAIDIAAGFPDSVEQHPLPDDETGQHTLGV